jgi:hypothetical protein
MSGMKKVLLVAVAVVGVIAALIVVRQLVGGWFWHPLAEGANSTCSKTNHTGCGYGFWSGFGSDISEITLVGAVIALLGAFWRNHNCHVTGCWRLSWMPHPVHGHPVCRKHHPDGQGRGEFLTAEHHTLEAHAAVAGRLGSSPALVSKATPPSS